MLVDRAAISTRSEQVTVMDKRHKPGHYDQQLVIVDNIPITKTEWVPDAWYADVDHELGRLTCKISEATFEAIEFGEITTADIGSGRITDNTYCDGITVASSIKSDK